MIPSQITSGDIVPVNMYSHLTLNTNQAERERERERESKHQSSRERERERERVVIEVSNATSGYIRLCSYTPDY
jgi:hypothetical protein